MVQIAAHVLVMKTACELAGQLYETLMHDDLMFQIWKKQNPGASAKVLEKKFIARNWPKCIETARATLALMLRSEALDTETKERIVEALALDQTLVLGRPDNAERQKRISSAGFLKENGNNG